MRNELRCWKLPWSEWAERDLEAAGAWVLENGTGPEFDGVALSIASQIEVNKDTIENSLAWASSIHDPRLRSEGMTGILTEWLIRDRANAELFITGDESLPPAMVAEAFKFADQNAVEEGPY